MALMLGHTKAAIKIIGKEFKNIAFIANIITQLAMLGYLVYNLISSSGLWYINLALLVLSLSYFTFTIICHTQEIKKETKKEVKAIHKWIKRVLKAFPISIAIYSLSLAASNLTPIALISPIIIAVGWLLDISINIIYLIIVSRIDLICEGLAADFGDTLFIGKYVRQATGKASNPNSNDNLKMLQEMATAEEEEWNEKQLQTKLEKKEERRTKIANALSSIFKKSN